MLLFLVPEMIAMTVDSSIVTARDKDASRRNVTAHLVSLVLRPAAVKYSAKVAADARSFKNISQASIYRQSSL